MTGWPDIESAPKDGTEVVIARAGWTSFPVAKWVEYPGNPVQGDDGEDAYMFGWQRDASGFCAGEEDYWLGWAEDQMPTHWMPLPGGNGMTYYEQISPMGIWCPVLSPDSPSSVTADGKRRKTRAVKEIDARHEGLGLTILQDIYGTKEAAL